MNVEQWMETVSEAYQFANIPFTENIKKSLLSPDLSPAELELYPGGEEAYFKSDRKNHFEHQET